MSEFKPPYETLQPLEAQLDRAVVSDQDKKQAQEDWADRFEGDRYQEILNAENEAT